MKQILFTLIISICFCFCAYAEVSFEAQVNIIRQDDDPSLARQEALKQAYREGFLKVAGRLTTKENIAELNKLQDEQLIHFIKETDVLSEKMTSEGYKADFNIEINGELLKQYMLENNMMEVISQNHNILIVPSYANTEYEGRIVFGPNNFWRQILLEKGIIKSANLTLTVIDDTPQNRALLTPNKVLFIDKETFEKLKQMNGFEDIYTVHAVSAGRNSVLLLIRGYGQSQQRLMVFDENGEPFEKAISEMVAYISQDIQNKNIDESSYKSKIQVVFYNTNLREWLMLQKKLNTVAQIKKVEAGAMESGKVSFSIDFSGTLDVLISTLKKEGLTLTFANGQYIIK